MAEFVASRRLLDNRSLGSVGAFLQESLRTGSKLSVVSAYFTIYAFAALEKELVGLEGTRFLFGEPAFISTLDPQRDATPGFLVNGDELALAERLRQSRAARACAEWIERSVDVRSVVEPGFLHGKMAFIQKGDYRRAVLGSSNFTLSGLGLGGRTNVELNVKVTDELDRDDLKAWFDGLWDDDKLVRDVKEEVLRHLRRLYVPNSPRFVYYKTLLHLFEAAVNEASEPLAQEQSLVKTKVWEMLFEFQRHGARAAIHKLQRYGGCILADSVGLGKTLTALAVIKYFELLNSRVLVLCPKRLHENWTQYQAQNNSDLNPLLADRLAFTVLSHTDLTRDGGLSGGVNLASLNWGNFDLVVIDESHNFRNGGRGRRDEAGNVLSRNRYERLMDDIVRAGVPTKVLLLSATPVNNRLSDLGNQFALMTGNDDAAFRENLGVPSINSALSAAQLRFNEWAQARTAAQAGGEAAPNLSASLPASFFTLLDALTLARSRRHIKRYYAGSLAKMGGFPKREKPVSITSKIDSAGLFPSFEAISDQIDRYKLALFNPARYVKPEFRRLYETSSIQNFSQLDRETNLIGMMKVNFLKRLESSVASFDITLGRTLVKIDALTAELQTPSANAATVQAPDAREVIPVDAAQPGHDDGPSVGVRVEYKVAHLDVQAWLQDLRDDRDKISNLVLTAEQVSPTRDAKLAELLALITEKARNPTRNSRGEENRKILVFTAFADTARYLFDNLRGPARRLDIHAALVVGSGANDATSGRRDFASILANFSPRSKRYAPSGPEIDLLIATDCISEGQNLQDCDLVVNYDIHWNPVRLIQRFGRIDRIGSLNDTVRLVNFWPTDDLNAYLNLKARVEGRMVLVDLSATGEDNPLMDSGDDLSSDTAFRGEQLKRLKTEILDLEDLDDSVTLSDFSLDDYRMDLTNFLAESEQELRDAPLGIYAIVPPPPAPEAGAALAAFERAAAPGIARGVAEPCPPGVIFCLRQVLPDGPRPDASAARRGSANPLFPFTLLFVQDDGTVGLGSAGPRETLDLYRRLCAQESKAHQDLHDLFDQHTRDGQDMSAYNALLAATLEAVRAAGQPRAAQLLAGRGVIMPKASERVTAETKFELITWLIVGPLPGAPRAGSETKPTVEEGN